MIVKKNCHNGFSLCLAFKQRLGAARKWPVVFFGGHFEFFGQLVRGRNPEILEIREWVWDSRENLGRFGCLRSIIKSYNTRYKELRRFLGSRPSRIFLEL